MSSSGHAGELGLPAQALGARFRAWLTAPTSFDGIFPPAARRLGALYVGLTLPVLAALSTFAHGAHEYLVLFAGVPLLLYGVPSIALSLLAIHKAPTTTTDRPSYLLWLAGTALFCASAVGILGGVFTDARWATGLGWPTTAAIFLLLSGGIIRLTRSRSGGRAFSVDMVEAAMPVVVVAAPCILIWGSRILDADDRWFTVPAGVATMGLIFGSYWALALVLRLGPNARTLERAGLALCLIGTANGALQVAQGLSGFTLAAPPLIAAHGACLSMCVLVPLHLPREPRRGGLDRLPPLAQVRAGYLATLVTLVGLPVLVLTTVAVDERTSWAAPFSLGVATLLVVLAGLRHLAGVHETRQLYADVRQASHQRHLLLAQLMQRADEDRHRVAAQLHEQAVSAYTSVVLLQGSYTTPGGSSTASSDAGNQVRHDLAHHADSLRDLMLAIQPFEADRSGTRTLSAPIRAYLDSLYGDMPAPRLTVTTSDDIFLDWTTETILLRVVQEALRNVWRHSDATNVDVAIEANAGATATTLRVRDDGGGYDPAQVEESGIATMRAFAAVVDGSIHVESGPGRGTTVVARLGATSESHDDARLLRLVPNRKLP